jgi:hypothetical protein
MAVVCGYHAGFPVGVCAGLCTLNFDFCRGMRSNMHEHERVPRNSNKHVYITTRIPTRGAQVSCSRALPRPVPRWQDVGGGPVEIEGQGPMVAAGGGCKVLE